MDKQNYYSVSFYCLIVLMIYLQVNNIQLCWDIFLSSWVETVLSRG